LMIHDTHLYVSGLFTTSIRRFDLTTGELDSSWGIHGGGFPQDLSVAPDRNGFLAGILGFTNGSGNISRYAFDGTFEGTFASAGGGGFTEATAFVNVPTSYIGDYNNDGVVDTADYVMWRNSLPTATLPNDLTHGAVGETADDMWRVSFVKRWPPSGSPLAGSSIPEPTSFQLMFFAI